MSTATPSVSAEAAIRELISKWEAAAQQKDIEGIMAHHTPDMIAFDVPPPLRFTSAAEYGKHWASFFPMFPGHAVFRTSELKITAGEDVAFATCLTHCGGTQADGTTCEGTARTTLGFQKIDGQWHFTHEHHSMPMSMGEECAAATGEKA